ncbi:DUF721 domain-containing protein [Asticcacaulis endophyticus]|uniref:DUF721 domain-containing protein n=1 Tax=Asticcacaulis endophyticus TaxID=1395890 RepID=A0A918Q7Q7_9CAUL|nr:DciA family protein [Asticcacaulis endophyticus]GGZ37112.1 hypothetical protein GCM10011273_24340 [Asticcacaulis endophyticus]
MKRTLPSLEDAVAILRATRTKRMPKPPPPVNRQITPLLKSLSARFEAYDTGAGRLKSRWPEIVGESLAKLSEPAKIITNRPATKPTARGSLSKNAPVPANTKSVGILEIRCEGAYAPILQHQQDLIMSRVNLFLGAGSVGRLRIVQGQVSQTTRQATAAVQSRPLNAEQELALQNSLKDVSDDRLRQTLLKLGRSVIARDNARAKASERSPKT